MIPYVRIRRRTSIHTQDLVACAAPAPRQAGNGNAARAHKLRRRVTGGARFKLARRFFADRLSRHCAGARRETEPLPNKPRSLTGKAWHLYSLSVVPTISRRLYACTLGCQRRNRPRPGRGNPHRGRPLSTTRAGGVQATNSRRLYACTLGCERRSGRRPRVHRLERE